MASPTSSLKIAVSRTGKTQDIMVVRVDGMVDAISAGNMEEVLTSLMAQGRYWLLIDLAGANYISSAGWGTFMSRLRDIRNHNGDIKLARMTPEVREIYDLLEFDGLIPNFSSLDAAIADFDDGEAEDSAILQQTEETPPAPAEPQREQNSASDVPSIASVSLDEAVRAAILDDPFQNFGEIRDYLREFTDGRLTTSWWHVFRSLWRQRLLARRARFRLYRRHRKSAHS